ncbi:MAG TPA: TonB-dependent receptor [Chitinophagaceae bacterium]|jgi:TonB-linked SusC/RagA family outer membrane protein
MKKCKCFLAVVLLLALYLAPSSLQAQTITITGVISNEKGEALQGVTVSLKGNSTTVLTDVYGKYNIKAPSGGTLSVSSIGYADMEEKIGGRTAINFTLKEKVAELNDVVVVGYGTQKKADLTGAIVTVSGSELTKRVATNPTQLLQGKLPGLSLVQGSGEAGNEGYVLRVRGQGTYSGAGIDPLVIVDGLPGSLNNLDPQNIESVTLLKDAASAAIYGTRGANGVILVTTKQGSNGKMQLSYDYNIGFTRATALPKNLIYNSAEYMTLYDTAAAHSGVGAVFSQAQISAYANATDHNLYPNFNWLNAIMRDVDVQTHHLGLSGGKNGTTYNVGLGYVDQPDVMLGFSFKKYNLQFNLTSKVNDNVSFGTSLTFNYSKRLYASRGSQDQFLSTLSQEPMYRPQLPDGSGRYVNSVYPLVIGPNKNSVAIAQNASVSDNDYYMQSSLYVTVKLLKGLEWKTSGGFNFDFLKRYDFKPVINQYNWFAGPNDPPERTLDVNGQGLTVTDNNSIYPVGYSQLTYTKSFGGHSFKLLGGTQAEYNKSQSLSGARNTPYSSNTTRELNAGPAGSQVANGTSSEWSLESFYGRLNYSFEEKYLLEANARYDASSRFPSGNKWGLFPSVSAGWVLTKEKFLDHISWLNNLKLRSSFGILGNQSIGNYPYQAVYNAQTIYNTGSPYAYSYNGSSASPGVAQNGLTDADIRWETTKVFDIGTDITLFKGLSLSFDWYNKLTYDILGSVAIPQYIGLNNPTINKGKMKNTGIEATVQYSGSIGQVAYSVGGNVEANKNTLVKYGPPSISTNGTINEEGQPYGSFYLYQFAGIFQSADEISKAPKQQFNPQPGYMRFKDVDGNNTIDANDRVVVPGIYPKLDYSFNASASWKNFDLSIFLYGSYGQKQLVNGWGIQPFDQGSEPTTDWLNAWTPANHSTTMPLLYLTTGSGANNASSNASTLSTYYLENASFLRIKNIQFGYNLPGKWAKRVAMSSLRLYFAGDNLVTFTKFPGLDPERVASNTRFVVHPQDQVYSFGIKAVF